MENEYINNEVVTIDLESKNLTFSKQMQPKRDHAKYWEPEYINKKINDCPSLKKKMYCRFLWLSGVRVTESVNLKKKDIDFKNDVMTVKWLKSRKYKYRVVPMNYQLKILLEHYTAGLNQEEIVFDFSRQYAFKIVKEVLGGHPHQLRHSFAVNCLRQGMDVVILSQLLGHKNLNTTREYLKIVPSDQGKELQKISF